VGLPIDDGDLVLATETVLEYEARGTVWAS
jgi:hypothetical protein